MSEHSEKRQFESLLAPILDFLLGLAMQLTRNRPDAEDLVQDAIVKAYRSFSTFERGSFRAWLGRILTDTFFTTQKRAERFVHDVAPGDTADSAEDRWPAEWGEPVRALENIPKQNLSGEVAAVLNELPAGVALAVYLADAEELTFAEIGEILDIPVATVRSRASRGRRQLQESLVDYARQLGVITKKKS